MKKLLLLLTISSSIFLIGCHDKGKYRDSAQSLLSLIQQYGNVGTTPCVAAPGAPCTTTINNELKKFVSSKYVVFELLENAETHEDGRVVFKNSDTQIIGINLRNFNDLLNSLDTLSNQAKAIAIQDFIFGSIKNLTPAGGDHFTFINGSGNPELYSEATAGVKDLERLAANLENQSVKTFQINLTTQYGLSADRAEVVAKNIYAYNKLSTKRALTTKEKNFFSNELLGVNYNQVVDSFNSAEGIDDLLEQAAKVNGTSPEQVSAIINELFL